MYKLMIASFCFMFVFSCTNERIESSKYSGDTLEIKQYYESGALMMKYYSLDNKRVKEYAEYYENGGLKFESTYVRGKLNGIKIFYDEHGRIISKSFYQNGEKSGPYFEYYRSGKLKYSGKRDTLFSGNYFEYFSNNALRLKVSIVDGQNKSFERYTKDGEIEKKMTILFEKSPYLSIYVKSDTVKKDDDYSLEFVVSNQILDTKPTIRLGKLNDEGKIIEEKGKISVSHNMTSIMRPAYKLGIMKTEGVLDLHTKQIPFSIKIVGVL